MNTETLVMVVPSVDAAAVKFGLMLSAMLDDSLPLVSKAYFGEDESRAHVLYWDGFESYIEGHPLEDMPTAMQRKGWWAANKCQGEAEYDNDVDYTTPSVQ